MGCMWSSELSGCDSREVRIDNGIKCLSTPVIPIELKPHFGEYKCFACGRSWCSRLSWPNRYQVCNRCKIRVYPHNLRELCPSNLKVQSKTHQEHKKELCQMCQQLGYYCGNLIRNRSHQRKQY